MMEKLIRPEILSMRAYESARSLVEKNANLVFLDANESPYAQQDATPLNRYPEPQPQELVQRFSEIYGISKKSLLIGRGSDEAIDILVRSFCRPGEDSILICPPTYGVYEIAAQIQGATTKRIPLKQTPSNFELDESAILSNLKTVKIIFLCSPNNPTGTAFDREALVRLCKAVGDRALVVVDEAYAEFSKESSMLTALAENPNLAVLRTLSKAWALAGARCGIVAAAPELISILHKVRAPYPLSTPTILAALEGTNAEAQAECKARVAKIILTRQELEAALRSLPKVVEIYKSEANYLLVRFQNSAAVMQAMRSSGIILRDRSSEPGLSGCIRITIGSSEENRKLLTILREL